ncbi:MAG: glutamate--tRNA ligase [Proteobacteria bacterium]|nr:glutamate--tRNA ligase [Pseudomonadota bacterium]
MAPSDRPVRVRIAPSPTGDPHVGTAYIALFNYVFAKARGGKFVLRIEDTDQTRARSDSEQMIFDALRWVGLPWDEGPDVGGPFGPYRQSERSAIYREHVDILLAKGEAYRCFCTSERLEKLRALQVAGDDGHRGYDRHCRELDSSARVGEPHVVRLKMPLAGPITFRDEFRGDITRDASEIDDQVLMKSDGLPTYHLANVVDDHLMEISHVVRAEEWISSTQKHVALYQAFGWEPPQFLHMPLLRNAGGSKISKRKNPVSIYYYRDAGILPEALRNFLGTMGWSFGGDREKFTLQEMIDVFTWDHISLGGPVFDMVKLTALNEKYLHELSHDELADRVIAWRLNKPYIARLMGLAQKRMKRLTDFIPLLDYCFAGDLDLAPVLADLKIDGVAPAVLAEAIRELVEKYEARTEWSHKVLEEESKAWATAHGWKPKQAYPLIRLGLTARKETPGLFDLMEVLGKEICRRRLREAARAIDATVPTPAPAPPAA